MNFLKEHSLGTIVFLLAAICLSLYLFLIKPALVRRQEIVEAIEGKFAQLQRHRDDPPSSAMVDRLSQEKEELERQYEEIVQALNFAEWVSLPEDTGDPLFHDEQIEEFERQIERAESELGRLAREADINLPWRLGFREERPESREELSMLSSHLVLARELMVLVTEAGVSELLALNPLPLPRKRMEMLPDMDMRDMDAMDMDMWDMDAMDREMDREMMEADREMFELMDRMEREREARMERRPVERRPVERRLPPVARDLLQEPNELLPVSEELKFELEVRAEISALTNLLHQIANHSYFFTVRDLEIRSVAVRRERALPEVRERDRRRRRRVPPRREAPPGMDVRDMEEMSRAMDREIMAAEEEMFGLMDRMERERRPRRELPLRVEPEEIERELEARLLVSAHFHLPEEEG